MTEWTEERVAYLKQLWTDSYTVDQCAALLGVSRGAIASKLKRMGIRNTRAPGLSVAKQNKRLKGRIAAEAAPTPGLEPEPPSGAQPMPDLPGRTILTLKPYGECHWPMGDPREANFYFCGEESARRIDALGRLAWHPYCLKHCETAYSKGLRPGPKYPMRIR